MKINSNITAYITNNAYMQSEKRLSAATARLSSGYKLNSAGDDPANFAIAAKMHAMIKGLDKVKTNTTTGVSVIETAEAAMEETQNMIQRMNELAVKGSNGTLSSSDRQNIQDEVNQLLKEIDRISQSVEFNGMKLLNGTFQDKGYTNSPTVTVMNYSEFTPVGHYYLELARDADGNYSLANAPVPGTGYDGYFDAERLFGSTDPAATMITKETVKIEGSDDFVDYVTIAGKNGAEIQFRIENGNLGGDHLDLDLTGMGSMRLQVGTEEGEVISASIPNMSVESIGLSGIDLRSQKSSQEALDQINRAMEPLQIQDGCIPEQAGEYGDLPGCLQ